MRYFCQSWTVIKKGIKMYNTFKDYIVEKCLLRCLSKIKDD